MSSVQETASPPHGVDRNPMRYQDWQQWLLHRSQLTVSVGMIAASAIDLIWTGTGLLLPLLLGLIMGLANLTICLSRLGSRTFRTGFLVGSTALGLVASSVFTAWAPAIVTFAVLLVVLTGLLAPRWVTYAVIASLALGYAVGGGLVQTGQHTVDMKTLRPTDLANWLRLASSVLVVGAVSLYLLRTALKVTRKAHDSTRDALGLLQTELSQAEVLKTARIQAETNLRSTYRQQAVGQLASGLAHHFNNLLTVARGLIDDLRQSATLAQVREHADRIEQMVDRGAEVLQKLMIFSRRRRQAAALVNVGEELLAFQDGLQNAVRDNVQLQISVEDCWAVVDPSTLRQLVLSLVLNATDALPHGGTVLVEIHQVTLDDTPAFALGTIDPGAYVAVSVRDSGVGMDEAIRRRAADPFFTTKPPERHSGLGLSTALGIAQAADGTLSIQSEPDAYTTVAAYFPLAEPAEPAEPHPASSPTDAQDSEQRKQGSGSAPSPPPSEPTAPKTGGMSDAGDPILTTDPEADAIPTQTFEPDTTDLDVWRADYVRRMARLFAMIAGAALVISAGAFQMAPTVITTGIVLAMSVCMAAVAGWHPRLSQTVRMGLLIGCTALIAWTNVLAHSYLSPGPLVCAFYALCLSAVLSSLRTAVVVLVMIVVTVLAGGLLHSGGTIVPALNNFVPDRPANWYRVAIIQGLALAILAISVLGVVDHIRQSTRRMRRAIAHLKQVRRSREREGQRKLQLEQMTSTVARVEAAGRLAGTVAHDLNNALQAMSMAVSQVEIMQSLDPEELAELVDDLEHAVDYGEALVTQFDLSAQAPPRSAIGVIDLGRAVERAAGLIAHRLSSRIALEVQTDDACYVRLSEGELNRVVFNVSQNAIHAMPDGGHLSIHVTTGDDRTVVLTVRDTGCGMDTATRTRAFEPFFTTKAADQGTGLGLAAVAQVIQRSHGASEIESEIGSGTTLTIRWPLESEPPPRPAQRPAAPGAQQGLVLVADDHDLVRKTISRALRRAGFEVIEAVDGDEARALLKAHPEIEVFCCDGIMPGCSSKELIAHSLATHPHRPVLLCSGYLPDALDPELFRDDVTFLQKPIRGAQLVQAVSESLQRSRD